MTPIILLADDHSLIRKGVKVLCGHNLGFSDVNEVASCKELVEELRKKEYTHLVLDINFADGSSLEILPDILRRYPLLKIAVLTMEPTGVYRDLLKQFGVIAFSNKDAHVDDILRFLRNFLQNENCLDTSITLEENITPFSDITERELQILHYWLQGIRTKEIAGKLGVTMSTISTAKALIFKKTKTSNFVQLKELASSFTVS
jgi:two-component system, NarL family, invasion response regulator UvrY